MKAINEKLKRLALENEFVKKPEIYQYFNNKEVDYQKILNARFVYKPLHENERKENIKKVYSHII
jgi:hypothetical protein